MEWETNGLGSLEKHPLRYLSLKKHRNSSRFFHDSATSWPQDGAPKSPDLPWPSALWIFNGSRLLFWPTKKKKNVVGTQNFTCPTCWIFCSIPEVFGWFPSLISVGMPPWWAAFFNNFSLSMTQNPPSNWNCETNKKWSTHYSKL